MKVESYKIKGWKEEETGILVAENKDWVLTKHIPVDYVVDGYKLYQKKHLKKRTTKAEEKQLAKVLKLKKIKLDIPKQLPFERVIDVLKWSEKKYGLFEFQDADQSLLFYGNLREKSKKHFMINMIDPDGRIEKDFEFQFNYKDIRSITFGSNYFNTIRLLTKNNKK